MTYREAYEILDNIDLLDSDDTNDVILAKGTAVILAKTAIKRLIPESRKWTAIATDKNGETDTYKCPICNNYVSMRYKSRRCEYDYCPYCGYMING